MFKLLKDGSVLKKLLEWRCMECWMCLKGQLSGHTAESRHPRACFRCETLVSPSLKFRTLLFLCLSIGWFGFLLEFI